MHKNPLILVVAIVLIVVPSVAAISPSSNVGMLRVASFQCPREVPPGAAFAASLDVEYAIQGLPNMATIRGAIYSGNANSTSPLWQSDPTTVSNGGDQVWNFTLTAPASEGPLTLTAYAFYLDNGTWAYFDNQVNGPGVSQTTLKVGKTANLDVNAGAAGITVTVNGATAQTSSSGDASFSVAVASSPSVSVPPTVEFQNSTRLVFIQWNDGVLQPQRQVPIDGDTSLTAYYGTEYLLTVNAGSTTQEWYDRGTNATINAPTSPVVPWPLSALGVTSSFEGWSGDVQSNSPQVNVTMDAPKTVSAVYASDYRPLAVPGILAIGIIVALLTFFVVRRRQAGLQDSTVEQVPNPVQQQIETPQPAKPAPVPQCPNCGRDIEEQEWAHCIRCGAKLRDRDNSTKHVPASS